MTKIVVIVGTRPETIKMAPVIRELQERNADFSFVHSGQHFDYQMSRQFIEELELPDPNFSFKLENQKPAAQIWGMMLKLKYSFFG